jgi:hypothetical protein
MKSALDGVRSTKFSESLLIYENRVGALNESSLIDNDVVDAGAVEAENLSSSGSGQDWPVRCNVVNSKRRRLKCVHPAVFGGHVKEGNECGDRFEQWRLFLCSVRAETDGLSCERSDAEITDTGVLFGLVQSGRWRRRGA